MSRAAIVPRVSPSWLKTEAMSAASSAEVHSYIAQAIAVIAVV